MIRRILAVVVVSVQACVGGPSPGAGAAPTGDTLTMEVDNRNFQGATVYAVLGGYRVRVGRVSGKTRETFTFRWQPDELQMVVELMGSQRLTSGRLKVFPGADDDLLLIIGVSRSIWAGRKAG